MKHPESMLEDAVEFIRPPVLSQVTCTVRLTPTEEDPVVAVAYVAWEIPEKPPLARNEQQQPRHLYHRYPES